MPTRPQVHRRGDRLHSLRGVRRLRAENESLRQQQGQLPDLEAVRERILAGLRVGKQSPEYKRTKSVIDRFISEVRSL